MRYIYNESTDPYYNLAAEEYLLYHKREQVFMLWVNRDVIVVGRNQNTMAEINYEYVQEAEIAVVRRLTGGGAVFHDKGNLNFTFITKEQDEPDGKTENAFAFFGNMIIGALATLGLDASLSGRNDLEIDGRKFSGTALTVYRGYVLHHGTLMLNIAVDTLSKALRVSPQKIEGKGVKSVRSRVTNLNEHLDIPIEIPQLVEAISAFIRTQYPDIRHYELTPEDHAAISRLADEKYRKWEWNYGASPKYNFSKDTKYPGGMVQARMRVQDGLIEEVRFFGDYFGKREIPELEQRLTGVRHDAAAIVKALDGIPVGEYFFGAAADDVAGFLA